MEIINPNNQAETAKNLYLKGDYEKAAEGFSIAQKSFQTQGLTVKAAEMANNQSVALLQIGQAQAALEAVAETEIIFQEANEDLMRAMAIGNRAACLEKLNRTVEAEDEYKRCAALLKDLGEDKFYADTMKSISALQLKEGRNLEALANMQNGIEEIKRPNFTQRLIKKILNLPSDLLNK